MDETERRLALGDFLRTRRERLQPSDVGLPLRSRRRTPGLRREEVAELAKVGVSWYTLLEQGRDVHPSHSVVENLAQALQLTPAEQRHLFFLARYDPLPRSVTEDEQITPALKAVVNALDPNPAFVLGRRWDALTWNRAADLVFHFQDFCPPHSHNVVWRFFAREADPENPGWVKQAQNFVAGFRASYVRYPADASFQTLLQDLQEKSDQFCLWWEQQNVQPISEGKRTIHDPILGALEFDPMTFVTPVAPDLHVKVFVALPETAGRLAQHLARASA
ncbi:MAG TPA: helix-turn-helix transcriptional regulator [Aggregatilineales bacterium]|nr:helix-turn-helix transcriptional regulator [Aggregatilineales bacterium]